MKRFFACIILILVAHSASAQLPDTLVSPNAVIPRSDSTSKISQPHLYRVNYWLSGSIIVAGNVGNVLAINRIKNKPRITDAELGSLNTQSLTGLDRWSLKQDASKWEHYDRMSDDVITTTILLPGLLVFDKNVRHEGIHLLFMYAEAHAIVATIYNYSFLGPTFQNKYRPIVYYDTVDTATRENGNNRNSFYGGHVATAAVATFMMSKVYCDLHPNIGAKKFLLYTAAAVPPLLISYLRVKALKHFPSDNLAGLAIGAFFGITLPELHKPRCDRTSLSMFTTGDGGVGLSLKWKLEGRSGTPTVHI